MTETLITRLATYTGKGEFYSGIITGERVTVVGPNYLGNYSIQSVENPGAWLSKYNADELRFES